jgi:hypothetical protein
VSYGARAEPRRRRRGKPHHRPEYGERRRDKGGATLALAKCGTGSGKWRGRGPRRPAGATRNASRGGRSGDVRSRG